MFLSWIGIAVFDRAEIEGKKKRQKKKEKQTKWKKKATRKKENRKYEGDRKHKTAFCCLK